MEVYENCLLCPRLCGVNRAAGQRGYCGETAELRIAFAGIHNGEEPFLKGKGGSGTIFISGCNLGCAFCQCFQISHGRHIFEKKLIPHETCRAVDIMEFAEICLALQEKGAENINIVTGSHVAPVIARGFEEARKQGLVIPALWNSSGYDGNETLEIIKDFVDVYLQDLKTLDSAIAARFSNAPDYPEHAAAAILKMMEFRKLRLDEAAGKPGEDTPEAAMISGVMIRHLIIPGFLENTRQVLRWFSENCTGRALLSVMTQYTPAQIPGKKAVIPNRFVSEGEYEAVLFMLEEFKIDDGFCQELTSDTIWLPDFNLPNPFPPGISEPVWHWAC